MVYPLSPFSFQSVVRDDPAGASTLLVAMRSKSCETRFARGAKIRLFQYMTTVNGRWLKRSLVALSVLALCLLGFWSFPVYAESFPVYEITDVKKMSVRERAAFGEKLIFGQVGANPTEYVIGKGQCPLCHGFFNNSPQADPKRFPSPPYGPHLFNFTDRIERLVGSPVYLQRPKDTGQPEAFPGSGYAASVLEYLAESNVCPPCYVVPGFGIRNSHDRESPMPKIHKPPISFSLEEFIAMDTWLFIHDGREPPSPEEIERAYRKFIPDAEWSNFTRRGK